MSMPNPVCDVCGKEMEFSPYDGGGWEFRSEDDAPDWHYSYVGESQYQANYIAQLETEIAALKAQVKTLEAQIVQTDDYLWHLGECAQWKG